MLALFTYSFVCCASFVLQGQRDPAVRALHSGSLLSDQCTGHGAFDIRLRVSIKTEWKHTLLQT